MGIGRCSVAPAGGGRLVDDRNWRLARPDESGASGTNGSGTARAGIAGTVHNAPLPGERNGSRPPARKPGPRQAGGHPVSPAQPRSVVPTIIALALTPQTRGVSQIAAVTVPADTDYLAIELQLESEDYAGYRAILKAVADNQVIWRSGRLKTRSSGDIKVVGISIRPDVLKSSRYMVEVSGISADGSSEIIGSYGFQGNQGVVAIGCSLLWRLSMCWDSASAGSRVLKRLLFLGGDKCE